MTKQKKVFVLVTDSICRGGQEITVKTFGTKKKAQEEMTKCYNAELNDWKQSFDDDEMFEVETTENSRSIWESGCYCENHIAWEIHEQEVL